MTDRAVGVVELARWRWMLLLLGLAAVPAPGQAERGQSMMAKAQVGTLLEDLTWKEAEPLLTSDTVVVIPLGAASKEHGPHLKLKNDWLIAEYLKRRVLASAKVVVAPTVNYHFYPAFVEY